MDTAPATTDMPFQIPHRRGRLMLLMGGLVLLIATSSWLLYAFMRNGPPPGNLFWGWFIANSAVTLVGLLLFAVVTALMDMRQQARWLVVFGVLLAESLLLTTGELVAFGGWMNLIRLLSWHGSLSMQLTIGLGTVLAIHTLLWPIRALLGWQIQWAGERPSGRERLLTTWHLAAWMALIGILLLLSAGSRSGSGWMIVMVLLAESVSLLAGLPALILATRRKHLIFWIPGVLAGLIGLSLAESELTFFLAKVTGSGVGVSVWFVGFWNGAVAGAVLLAVFLLRWAGLTFHLPISHQEAALRCAATDGLTANSLARREFQFSLRSLLIVTTLLCLGPGAYIAWERDQCRRGTENLVLVEKLGGKLQSNYQPRPPWLQTILGSNSFRYVGYIELQKRNVLDRDLPPLSGLPGLGGLRLDETQVSDVGLASLSHVKNLQHLLLTGTQVTDAGLVHLRPLTKLSSLSLDNTKVTDAGLVHLSGLTNLRTLQLQKTNVTGAGLHHLSPLANLDWLFLDNTSVGDAGLTHLPANLKWLGLTGTKITDAGLVSISRLSRLENLHLSNNPITDAGLTHLESLPNLQILVIKDTQVTDAGAAKLNAKLPALKIHR